MRELRRVIEATRTMRRVDRDMEATERWRDVYEDLSDDHPGAWGSVTARAEAHVLRLSLLYALLDASPTVRLSHLEAALAVWRYCSDSARFIFGTRCGTLSRTGSCNFWRARAIGASLGRRSATGSTATRRRGRSTPRSTSSGRLAGSSGYLSQYLRDAAGAVAPDFRRFGRFGRRGCVKARRPVPRLALSPEEAAEALGMSRAHFYEHVYPDLRVVRCGQRRLVPIRELDAWLDREAMRTLGAEVA